MDLFANFEDQLAAAADDAARLALLNRFAFALARAGDGQRALAALDEVEILGQRLKDDRALGRAASTRGICHYLRADYLGALEYCLRAYAVAERTGDDEGLIAALLASAASHYQMGTMEEAHTTLIQVLGLLETTPDDALAFRAHNTLGAILSNKSKYEDAETHFEMAIAIATRSGDEFNLQRASVNRASLHHKIGLALREGGQDADARVYMVRGVAVCEAIRADPGRITALRDAAGCAGTLGELYVSLGRDSEAVPLFTEMLDHGMGMQNPHVQAEALMHLGKLHTRRGRYDEARNCLNRSVELAAGANIRHLIAEAYESLAQWCEVRGDFKQALAEYKRYHALHEELLRAELESTSRARALWMDFQQARNEARTYRERAETLSRDNLELSARAVSYERAALEDPLTGLSNRRHLDLRLAELVDASHEHGKQLVVAVADVDHFKAINDGFTHTLGDSVLRAIAAMIRVHCRDGDLSARYGGDEFVLCLRGVDAEAGAQVFERLRAAVADHDWNALQPGLRVTLSIGVAEFARRDDLDALLKRADEALYRAKNAGRNRVVTEPRATTRNRIADRTPPSA